jgi:glycosyltransferase involved in cell wall biosynthesis
MQLLNTSRGKVGNGLEGTLAPVNFLYFFRQVVRLLALLVFRRPAILHQTVTDGVGFWKESTFMLLGHLFAVRVIAHVHGNWLDTQYRQSSRRTRRWIRAALCVPDLVVVLSERWRRIVCDEIGVTSPVVIVANSVGQSVARMVDSEGFANRDDEGHTVLFLGGLGKRKGLPDAIRAIPLVRRQVPEAEFVFAGPVERAEDEEMVQELRASALRTGGASFPGLVTGAEKLALLSKANVFILPSYHENLPVAILEAMAAGLPVVATAIAGIPEVVEDGMNGFLIKPGDYEALADRIVLLMRRPELRREMGSCSVAKIRTKYHPQVFATRFEHLYLRLLAGRQSDAAPDEPATGSETERHESL